MLAVPVAVAFGTKSCSGLGIIQFPLELTRFYKSLLENNQTKSFYSGLLAAPLRHPALQYFCRCQFIFLVLVSDIQPYRVIALTGNTSLRTSISPIVRTKPLATAMIYLARKQSISSLS